MLNFQRPNSFLNALSTKRYTCLHDIKLHDRCGPKLAIRTYGNLSSDILWNNFDFKFQFIFIIIIGHMSYYYVITRFAARFGKLSYIFVSITSGIFLTLIKNTFLCLYLCRIEEHFTAVNYCLPTMARLILSLIEIDVYIKRAFIKVFVNYPTHHDTLTIIKRYTIVISFKKYYFIFQIH